MIEHKIMTENTQNEKKNSWFSNIRMSEAATIAIIPVVAQIIVFVYQCGYFGVFQIPVTLISFSLNDLFMVIAGILILSAIIYYYGDLVFSIIQFTSEPIRDKLLRSFGAFIFLFILFFSYGLKLWREWLPALLAVILILLLEFILPILQFKGKGNYLEKLKAHAEQRAKSEQNREIITPYDKLLQLLGPKIFLFLLALCGVYHFGRAAAMTQIEFRVANTIPEVVVLWMGDNRFIVAPFDRASKMIEPGFQILLVGEDPTIRYRLQKVGPLSLDVKPIAAKQPAPATSTISFVSTTTSTVSFVSITPHTASTSTVVPIPSLVATRTRTPTVYVQSSSSPAATSSPMP